jgi:hypothetical protein
MCPAERGGWREYQYGTIEESETPSTDRVSPNYQG